MESPMDGTVWAWRCVAMPRRVPNVLKPTAGRIEHKAVLGEDLFIPGDGSVKYVLKDVHVCQTRSEAVAAYNAAIRQAAAEYLRLASATQDLLIKTEKDGWDADGCLEDFPLLAVDLSSTAEDIIEATDRKLTLLEDSKGKVIPWDAFLARMDAGDLDCRDGQADLMIDGLVSENVLVDLYRYMVYVADKYLVPFEQVGKIFDGHEVNAVWFDE